MSEKLTGHIDTANLKGKTQPFTGVGYDDTELRKLIENNLVESKEYTDNEIASFEEQDPTMLAISNLEIEEIFKKWEE